MIRAASTSRSCCRCTYAVRRRTDSHRPYRAGDYNQTETLKPTVGRPAMADGRSTKKLVGSVLLCEAAGVVGSVFTRDSLRDWYPTLQKPSFTPPDWVFGPVWTVLYAMMGVSLYLASRQREEVETAARGLFAVQ